MANAVMPTGRSDGTPGENHEYAFRVSYIRPVFLFKSFCYKQVFNCEWVGVCFRMWLSSGLCSRNVKYSSRAFMIDDAFAIRVEAQVVHG